MRMHSVEDNAGERNYIIQAAKPNVHFSGSIIASYKSIIKIQFMLHANRANEHLHTAKRIGNWEAKPFGKI
jgi:hypothetical protein